MIRFILRTLCVCLVLQLAVPSLWAWQKKKKEKKEEVTQTLEVPPDPPPAVKAEVSRMVFHTSPLTNKGLLSQQVRDAVKALWRSNQGAQIVKIRAFVAGTGDLRRVQSIVSEMFSEKRLNLPVLSVVQVGQLPMEAAQVVLEATSIAKKPVNPHGLTFISGKGATAPLDPSHSKMLVQPLAEKSVADLKTALSGAAVASSDVLRVTCLQSSLDDYSQVHLLVAREFPKAALTFAQTQRAPESHVVECEAVARLKSPVAGKWKVLNPPGLRASTQFSQLALAGPGPVVLTGSQMAFRTQDSDVRLAFDRMNSSLQQNGTSLKNVFWSAIYPLTRAVTDKVRSIRFEYYDKENPPASTLLLFEGLPSVDASFALEVIAGVP